MFRSIMACLLLCSVCYAEPPKAVITGPTNGHPGDLIVLDSSSSTNTKFSTWRVWVELTSSPAAQRATMERLADHLRKSGYRISAPDDSSSSNYLEVKGTSKLMLASHPGTYRVALAVSNDEDIDLTLYKVEVTPNEPGPAPGPIPIPIPTPTPGPTPDPGPTPTPTPTPELTLTAAVSIGVAQVVTATTREDFLKLAEAYDKVASLGDSGSLPTVDYFLQTSKVFVVAGSGSIRSEWQTIETQIIQPRLTQLQILGGLATVSQHSKVWKEIAVGIRSGAGAQPPPTPVPTPTPTPQPTPTPTPTPDPGPPTPVPAEGLRVFIKYEKDDLSRMPQSQVNILTSPKLRTWLDQNASGYRFWDQNTPMSDKEDKVWKDAMQLQHGNLPWIFVSDGKKPSISQPLPKTVDETLSLLKKFASQ